MASNKRTIYLGLDYSDFTGGVTEVNRKMSLLDSEFKLAQQEAKNLGDETGALTTKQQYLTDKITLQAKKVDAAREAWENARTTGNASEKQVEALSKKYIQEQTSLAKLEGQLKETDEEQQNLNKDSETFGDTIRNLASSLGINISPALENLASKFDAVDANVGTAVIGIGAMISSLVSCSVQLGETADDLLTLSSQTGMTTDTLQKLEYASEFVDVSVDTMASSMRKLTSNMSSARDGSSTLTAAFKELHVKITDGSGALRDSEDVFYDAIDALGKISNETERDALAMEIFGKSATDLNPLIEAGSEKLKALGIEAEDLGLVLSSDELQSAGEFNDALQRMKNIADGLKNSLGTALIKPLTNLLEVLGKIPASTYEIILKIGTVIASIALVVKAIKSIAETQSTLKTFFSAAQGGFSKTTLIVMGVVAALVALAAIIAVIIGKGDDLNNTMNSVSSTVAGMQSTVTNAQSATYSASNHASGTTDFKGGRTWVGEAGPELVSLPGGSSITPADKVGATEYNTFNITLDASNVDDFTRIVSLMKNQKMALRRV